RRAECTPVARALRPRIRARARAEPVPRTRRGAARQRDRRGAVPRAPREGGGMIASGAAASRWQRELDERRARARGVAEGAGCEALLVFGADRHGQTFRYLTDFEPVLGDMWLLLADPPQCFLTFQWQIEEARRLS